MATTTSKHFPIQDSRQSFSSSLAQATNYNASGRASSRRSSNVGDFVQLLSTPPRRFSTQKGIIEEHNFANAEWSLSPAVAGPRRFSVQQTLIREDTNHGAELMSTSSRRFSVQDTFDGFRGGLPSDQRRFSVQESSRIHLNENEHVVNNHASDSSPAAFLALPEASSSVGRRASTYEVKIHENKSQRALAYWNSLLLNDFIPSSFPLPQGAAFTGGHVFEKTSMILSDARTLYRSCADGGFTTLSMIQAAWAVIVSNYTNTHDVCFAYRPHAHKIDDSTLHTFYRRVLIDNKETCKDFIRDVNISYLEALAHQECSESDILSGLDNFHTTLLAISVGGTGVSDNYFHTEHDLTVLLDIGEDTITVEFCYSTGKIVPSMINSIADSFRKALYGFATSYMSAIGKISLLSELDKTTIWDWNEYLPPLIPQCVHETVEAQVLLKPDFEAICSFDQDFSYRELDEASGRLAAHLISVGVGPGVFVPLCFDKSSWAIVSMFAVLKAGGACASVSPAYPAARMALIMDDLNPRAILASPQHMALFSEFSASVIGVDATLVESLSSLEYQKGSVCHTDPAFCVYTSGSTGKPKGVVVSHSAMVTSAHSHGPVFGIGPDSRAVQYSNYTFDTSIEDIFTSLQLGGTVCVISEDERLNNLAQAIEARKANFAELTPTVANLLKPSETPSLKYISMGGESLTQAVVDLWAPHVQLLNTWGPSEASINASSSLPLALGSRPSNIGRAVGCRLWIVDPLDYNVLVPIGCTGEILIEGNILANGYLHDQAKTSNAFIENPQFASKLGPSRRRMYKTGDLAYYSPELNGSIEFIGRKDYQVKLRGQRFELGEVETHLAVLASNAKNVAADLFTPDPKNPSKRMLVAFFHMSNSALTTPNTILPLDDKLRSEMMLIQQKLANLLPSYMNPSLFVPMSSFPLSINGKLDRKRLAEILSQDFTPRKMSMYSLSANRPKRIPTKPNEMILQTAWSSVLVRDRDGIGLDDNFLRVGGDSLAAMKLASELRVLGYHLNVSDILRNPVFCDMAVKVVAVVTTGDLQREQVTKPFSMSSIHRSSLAELLNVSNEAIIEDAFPCTPLQQGLIAITLRQPFAYTAREVFRLSKDLELTRLRRALHTVAVAYPILRTTIIQASSTELLQVVTRDVLFRESAVSLELYMEQDCERPMVYGEPLWRFAILQDKKNGDDYLTWTAHHAGKPSSYDGWLENNLLAALRAAYDTGRCDKPQPFVDFIVYLQQLDPESSTAYWKTQLSGPQPTSFPPPLSTTYRVQTDKKVSFRTRLSIDNDLKVLTSSFLRAAWAFTVSLYSDSTDVIFASTLSGRQAPVPRIEDVAGPIITTVPVRIQIDRMQTIAAFVGGVHEQALQMMPHEQFGLQNIRRISEKVRDAMDIQSLFLVQPAAPDSDPDAKALGLERLPGGEGNLFDAYALNVECFLDGEDVILEAQYDSNVIPQSEMDLMIRQFAHVIKILGSEPADTRLQDLNVVSSTEYDLMRQWNGPFPETVAECVHHLIEQQVMEIPDAQAICSFDGDMTYAELWTESNRLAHWLVSIGVDPEIPVALCLDKGRLTVVSMLAVLIAGGICVSLNASHPRQRLEMLVADLGSKIILVSPHYLPLFEGMAPNIVAVDQGLFDGLPIVHSTARACATVQPTNAAFIVYTSGSTGTPKGVVLQHQAISTSSRATGSVMGLERGTRVLAFASFTYDVSLQDVFFSLARGCVVCVISEEERFNNLTGAINRTQATWADLTSTVAAFLDPAEVPTLKTLSLGGEPMRPELATRWEQSEGEKIVFNGFGPAECSVNCLTSVTAQRKGNPANIGTPLASWVWVVDPLNHNRLKPVGTIGELLIEGPLLAREYLFDQAKTAASFIVTNPMWGKDVESETSARRRFYATGDLVKLQPDGTFIYYGRADRQVKLNGQRVELGEVESNLTLATGDSIKLAVELYTAPSMEGRKTLAAFLAWDRQAELVENTAVLVLSPDILASLKRFREILSQRVPSHFIPGYFFPVSHLPTNASGKLDRRALHHLVESLKPELLDLYSLAHATVTETTSSRELHLRELWCTILKIPQRRVGPETNFFGIGGDSVAAMQLVAKAREHDLLLTVAQVFEYPTLATMAQAVKDDDTSRPTHLESFALCPSSKLEGILTEFYTQSGLARTQEVEDVYPASAMQESLMALTAQNDDAYVLRNVYRIPNNVNMESFIGAWELVVQAHAILRTRLCFSSALRRYMQVVVKESIGWVTKHDSVQDYINDDKSRIFSAGSPLAHFGLITNRDDNLFIFSLHHAIYDGFSLQEIFEDLQNAFSGLPLANQGDVRPFIAYLESQPQADQETYWEQQLGGEPATSWPQVPRSNRQEPISCMSRRALRNVESQRSGFTTSLLLRAAWALTVSQYASSEDIILAVTLSGRDIPVRGVANIVGPLLTTVPLRIGIDRASTVADYLHQVQHQATGMIPFQHYGLQNIQAKHESPLNLNHLFIVQPKEGGEDIDNSLGLQHVQTHSGDFDSTYALNIEVILGDDEIIVEAVYDLNILTPALMESCLDQYVHIMKELVRAEGAKKLKELQPVNPIDMRWIQNLNKDVPVRIAECVHGRVEQQVLIRPHAEAIRSFDGDMTYAQLNAAAELLAGKLQHLGIGPGHMVPLCFDKSRWAVIAMLATLKAGGACVSVSAAYPWDRLSLIVNDTRAIVVLASPQHVSCFDDIHPEGLSTTVLGVDEQLLQICKGDEAWKPSAVTHTDPAFVVYTSGSTGRPKGVVVEHGSMVTSAAHHGAAFGLGPTTRCLQFASYTFDASIQDLFTSLQRGGCICIASEEERMSELAGAMNRRGANYADLTPTVASLLTPADVPGLKTLSLGGEILTEQVIQLWLSHGTRLINTYGPSEASIDSSCVDILDSKFSVGNIGKPLGCVFWVVRPEDHNQLVPAFCVGEMLIEGPILAREYLNDPAKTDAAFISALPWLPDDPISQKRRMYKTGDLVSYRQDGGMEYHGRKDQQVKINGLRIELGEIENQLLLGSSKCKAAAVEVVQPDSRGKKKALAAFVTFTTHDSTCTLLRLTDDHQAVFADIKQHLENTLPAYFLPTLWLPLSKLPTNASGKLDRKALRAVVEGLSNEVLIEYSLATAGVQHLPTSPMELSIQQLWADILGIDKSKIMANSNFFQIGGESIRAMQLATLSRSRGVNITVANIFKHPTLSQQAQRATSVQEHDDLTKVYQRFALAGTMRDNIDAVAQYCAVESNEIVDILPSTPLQEGLMSITSRQSNAYVALLAFKIPASVDLGCFQSAWAQLVDAFDILRTRLIVSEMGQTMQVVVDRAIEWTTATDLATYLEQGAAKPMVYGGALARFALLEDPEHGAVFILEQHHALYDGWSINSLFAELEHLYYGRPLSASTQFSVFIEYLQTVDEKDVASFWRDQLEGAPQESWPSIPEGHVVKSNNVLTRTVPCSASQYTKSTLLRATWALVLGLYSNRYDLIFAETLSGRNVALANAQDIMGPLLTTIPSRISFSQWLSIEQFLEQVQRQAVDMIEFQHTGLQNIRLLVNDLGGLADLHSAFIVQPSAEKEDNVFALGLESIPSESGDFDTFAVNLACSLDKDHVELEITFDDKIVNEKEMMGLLSQFENILQQLSTASSSTQLRDLSLLSTEEDRHTFDSWLDNMDAEPKQHNRLPHNTIGVAVREPANVNERMVQEVAARVLQLPIAKINLNLSFVTLGGDSISAMRFASQCRAVGLTITTVNVLKCKTLGDVAETAVSLQTVAAPRMDNENVEVRISPIQQWYFENSHPASPSEDFHYNQSSSVKFTRPVEAAEVVKALHVVIKEHSMLRSRFVQDNGIWTQKTLPYAEDLCLVQTHSVGDLRELAELVNTRQRFAIDIENGPVFVADFFILPDGAQYLVMIAHHLVVDLVSWRNILDDVEILLNGTAGLEPEAMSFTTWTLFQAERASSKDLDPEYTGGDFDAPQNLSFWGADNETVFTGQTLVSRTVAIESSVTELVLGSANTTLRTETLDLLLAAVWLSFLNVFHDRENLTIFNEGHGREPWSADIDVSRTVGWFTTIFPISVERPDSLDCLSIVRLVKDNRSRLRNNGWAYFTSKYGNDKGKRASEGKSSVTEVLFNYHGLMQQLEADDSLMVDADFSGLQLVADQGARVPTKTLFDIGVTVANGVLEYSFDYQEGLAHQDRISSWIQGVATSLGAICEALCTATPAFTLADLPLLQSTSYEGLEKLHRDIIPNLDNVKVADIESIMPCSPMQDGILLSQARNDGSYETEQIYEVTCGEGETISAHKLAQAWQLLIVRHSALRTVFIEGISNAAAYDQIVLRSYTGVVIFMHAQDSAGALTLFEEMPTTDYKRSRPPHRLTICTVSEFKLLCRFEASHVITDGTSGDILVQDLTAAYSEGVLPSWHSSPCADFIQSITEIPMTEKLSFWKSMLAGVEATIFPRLINVPASQETANVFVELPAGTVSLIQSFCRNQGITPASLLQLAWSMVLSVYTGTDDVCFGYLASGRDAPVPHIEHAIGAFVNMMICRVNLEGRLTCQEVLTSVHDQFVQAMAHQHVGLADLQHSLGVSGPMFNTIMSIQMLATGSNEEYTPGSLVFEDIGARDPTEYEIAIDVTIENNAIDLSLDFALSCMDETQATRVLSTFQTAITRLLTSERTPIGNLSLINDHELTQLVDWNGDFPATVQKCIHSVFLEQVNLNPHRPAIFSFDLNLSYVELNDYAVRLAHHLQTIGVGPGTIVPLCFPKTTWAAIAQLAVLKAGGACASLGPDQPIKRLHAIIQDTGASVVLCSPKFATLFQDLSLAVISVDAKLLEDMQDTTPVHSNVKPSDTAFVVFTSGSTGVPKGVMLSHAALATSSQAHGSAMGINSGTRVLAFAAFTYDVSIQDLWTTLQRGGTTVIISDEDRLSTERLTEAINNGSVNWADLTPTVAALLRPESVPTLRTISLGGEAVSQGVLDMWENAGLRVINGYGPAENSVNSAMSDAEHRHGDASNIGRPLASWFWVTRPNNPNSLVPLGTVGELLIESPQLADCYLNDHLKSNEAFIRNPSWIQVVPSGQAPRVRRMYRTGDMVKLTEYGTYIFIGRADRQTKIRGQRIELGEIEAQVKLAVPVDVPVAVELVKSVSFKQRIAVAAFFDFESIVDQQSTNTLLMERDAAIEAYLSTTRELVAQVLPSHMLPTFFIPLRRFPVNASGKLDRRQLRDSLHEVSRLELKRLTLSSITREQPQTVNERVMHDLWSVVLGLSADEFGINDNFLNLGGDSIVAMKLAKEARSRGVQISVADILRNPKLVDIAKVVTLVDAKVSGATKDVPVYQPFFLLDSPNDKGHIMNLARHTCQLAADDNIADIHPVTDFQALSVEVSFRKTRNMLNYFTWTGRGTADMYRLERSVRAAVEKFDILRSAFVLYDDRIYQVVYKQRSELEIAKYSTNEDLESFMNELQDADMGHPPSFGQPPAQFAIVKHKNKHEADKQFTLVVRLSHAQYDGTSTAMIFDFIESSYKSEKDVEISKSLSQAHYMHQIYNVARQPSLEYWQSLLEGSHMTNFVPVTSHEGVSNGTTKSQNGNGNGHSNGNGNGSAHPPQGLQSATRQLPSNSLPTSDFTFATVIKAAWASVLTSLTTCDVMFGTLVAGRNLHGDAESVVGACVNYVPVRLDVARYPTASALMKAVSEQALASIPHEHIGFKDLAKNCTDWPPGQFFSSLVIHQNLLVDDALRLGEVTMEEDVFNRGMEPTAVLVETGEEEGFMNVAVNWQDGIITPQFAGELVERLCRTIMHFLGEPEGRAVL